MRLVLSPCAFLPRHLANPLYNASRGATCTIVDSILDLQHFDLDVHDDAVVSARSDYQRVCDTLFNTFFSEISSKLDPLSICAHFGEQEVTTFLVMPLAKDNINLTAPQFRDALAIRYRKPLLNVPRFCDGCGSSSCLDHFLICKKGGLITQRHNEFRDADGDLAALVWGPVKREPIVKDAQEDDSGEVLIADLCV